MDIIKSIEAAALKAGVTPAKVVQEAGLNRTQWARWQSGKFEPRLASVRAIEAAIERLAEGQVE
jgi:predicted transcriptional regulator